MNGFDDSPQLPASRAPLLRSDPLCPVCWESARVEKTVLHHAQKQHRLPVFRSRGLERPGHVMALRLYVKGLDGTRGLITKNVVTLTNLRGFSSTMGLVPDVHWLFLKSGEKESRTRRTSGKTGLSRDEPDFRRSALSTIGSRGLREARSPPKAVALAWPPYCQLVLRHLLHVAASPKSLPRQ